MIFRQSAAYLHRFQCVSVSICLLVWDKHAILSSQSLIFATWLMIKPSGNDICTKSGNHLIPLDPFIGIWNYSNISKFLYMESRHSATQLMSILAGTVWLRFDLCKNNWRLRKPSLLRPHQDTGAGQNRTTCSDFSTLCLFQVCYVSSISSRHWLILLGLSYFFFLFNLFYVSVGMIAMSFLRRRLTDSSAPISLFNT